MKVYQITLAKETCPFTEKTIAKAIEGIKSELDGAEVGQEITIKVLEMTEQEYDALPEWMGP